MEINQKERIARYSYGINIATTLEEDLEEYIETKIYKYIYKNFTDYILQLLFQEESKGFTIKDFRKIRSITRAKLRTYLLQRGVYVAIYSNRYPLYKVLYNALIEEKPYKWTDKEIIIIHCLTSDLDPCQAHADYSLYIYGEKTLFEKTP